MIDAKTFGAELADIVKGACDPLLARLDAQENRLAAYETELDALRAAEPPRDGKDADPASVAAIVLDSLSERLESIERALTAPADLPDFSELVAVEVAKAVSDLPEPEKGEPGADGTPGDKGVPGADGVGLAGAMIGRDGDLIVTLTNGVAKSLGPVVGKDGAHGDKGDDGLGFDDLAFVEDAAGRVTVRFARGTEAKEFRLPGIAYRGPFKDSAGYEKGDAVTYGGSLWISEGEAEGKPGTGKGWRLAVKKGRDGVRNG